MKRRAFLTRSAQALAVLAGAPGRAAEFAFPEPDHALHFPRDHGSHPDFRIEWWYITGHLWSRAEPGRRFGFQATFFRQAGEEPGAAEAVPAEAFASDPIYLAHMSLLDVARQKFIFQERLNRSGWDAGASVTTLDVTNGNWSLRFKEPAAERMELIGSVRSEALFHLLLAPQRPLVQFGAKGISRKGADAHAASYYLTFPRLAAEGTLRLGAEELAVHGTAWMDHEISSSQLSAGQSGWDWAAIQFLDGRSLMAYRMRRTDGSTDPFSTLAWVGLEGPPKHYGPDRFTWQPLSSWKSPHTGAVYPNEIAITAPDPDRGASAVLHLVPLAADQELTGGLGGIAYWEGACRVLDGQGKEIGSAFLELTGYAKPLTGLH